MPDDSLIDDVPEGAAAVGRTEARRPSAITDDLIGVGGEARCHLEAALVMEEPWGTTSGPERCGR